MVHTNQTTELNGVVQIIPACGTYRTCIPKFSQILDESTPTAIADCTYSISMSIATVHSKEEKVSQQIKVKEKGVTEPDPSIQAMSALRFLKRSHLETKPKLIVAFV
jgi:hypothetical protein